MMKGPVHCFAALLLTGLCSAVPAGKEFATTFMQNHKGEVKSARFQIQVTAPPTSQGTTNVTVKALGKVYKKSIEPGKGELFMLPEEVEMIGSKTFDKTVLIQATQEVTVVSLNYKEDTADTSVLYPLTEWGTEYYVFTPPSYMIFYTTYKEFAITNHQYPNSIWIFLRGSVTFQGKHYSSGSKLSIKLEPFESVQIQSQDDLTGSKVVSERPVAVLSGHSCAEKYTTCNHVYEQLLPVKSWGNKFIIAPLNYHYNKLLHDFGRPQGHDSVYVQASELTIVTANVGGKAQSIKMHAGQTIEIASNWPSTIYLTSDKAIQVLFEFNGGTDGFTGNHFDPFLINILPTNQFSVSYALDTQEGFDNLAILVAPSNDLDGIKLDNSPLPSDTKWSKVDGSEFSFTVLPYGTTAGFHQITHHKSPFGVYSIGTAYHNGYGSAASANYIHDCRTIVPKCQKDEECKMYGTSPICVKKPKAGTCWVMGDPHYRTFDGHYFNFMSTCTYTMAKNCHVDKSQPAFEVEAKNEDQAGSKAAVVDEVIIKVYGYTFTIVRSEYGLVRMNYTLWNLPINMDNGKVRLVQSGLSVILETDFGLVVQYDWEQHLVINVPGSFAGKVCGLCGNFNGKDEDDMTTPTGSVASSTVAFGKSWRVPHLAGDAHCSDECTGKCESCANQGWFGHLTDRAFCSLLTHIMDGPFSSCNTIIEPKVYHENCLYDVCMGDGRHAFLCDTLQVYSDTCQRAGVKILNWRNLAFCPEPSCPENSHYEFCGNACPATCDAPDAPSKCKQSCVETCTCDEGYLLSGTKCVPKAQCGCNYYGRYIEAGRSFWANEGCTERCTCKPGNGQVQCEQSKCGTGLECKVVDDIRECHPKAFAKCTVHGDPHYTTFDGHHYDFQGTCVYQMAGVCSSDPKLIHFNVNVQNDGHGKTAGSNAKLVEVEVFGNTIVISRDNKGSVLINTELHHLPVSLDNGKIKIMQIGSSAEILTDFGLQVSYDWQSKVSITVPSSYAAIMCGLCGNYNLNPKDDLKMKNGKQAATAEELGRSWRVAEIPGCVEGCKDKKRCPSCDITLKEKFETNDYCGKIKDPKGPFAKCHAIENPDEYFKDCVFDVCLNNDKKGNNGSWCDSFSTYTIACQERGIEVDQWRNKDFCPASELFRPFHSHYEHCVKPCHATCDHVTPPRGCKYNCTEGWACNENYILSADKCVPFNQCGCHYKNRYYQRGEKFYPNGLCEEECICNNGTVHCKKYTCGPDEKCEVKKGVRSCQPLGHGNCTISGDPHYNTFDNGTYDFQGTCTYTAAQSCHTEGTNLNRFSVVVENEKWYAMSANPQVSVAKAVSVEVYGHILILRKDQLGMIMVNGVQFSIPFNTGPIQVYQDRTYYVIKTDFGLKVTYDMIYRVIVTVPGNYRGKTCGLCGNFNGNKADEFQLPDGKIIPNNTKNILTFGAAWKVSVPGVVCEDGCSGDTCPKCDSKQKAVFEQDCKIITDAYGPFAACHGIIDAMPYYRDCVYDVCQAKGARHVLCGSISAYMADCQTFGVKVNKWRNEHFCPLSCSANSHYQVCAEICDKPCPGLIDTITCTDSCAEGCTCNDGYYFNGTGCVSHDMCSCYFQGRTYKLSESMVTDDCQLNCKCTAEGQVRCDDMKCGAAESCDVKNYVRGCYPKQCVMNGGLFTPFNGEAGSITVMGAYEIMASCEYSPGPDWFRVVVSLQECTVTGQKTVVAVYVFLNDMTVTLTDKQDTWINGKKVILSSLRNNVPVKAIGKSIVVEKSSSFRLSYSRSQQVTVTVNDSMVGKVCGACGTLQTGYFVEFDVETMQERMAAFVAQDFPTSC